MSASKRGHYRFVIDTSVLIGVPEGYERVKLVVAHAPPNTKVYTNSGVVGVHPEDRSVEFPGLSFSCHVPVDGKVWCCCGVRWGAMRGPRRPRQLTT
jgi:hypothetical protein